MSCTYTTDELHEKREQLQTEIDDVLGDARHEDAVIAQSAEQRAGELRSELETVEDLLESRGEL